MPTVPASVAQSQRATGGKNSKFTTENAVTVAILAATPTLVPVTDLLHLRNMSFRAESDLIVRATQEVIEGR